MGRRRDQRRNLFHFLVPNFCSLAKMKLKKIDLNAMMEAEQKKRKIWKLVLTGGPCGGKTTGQARLSTFFENLGWKVYRVPETATVLLGGGVNFADLPEYAQIEFQENLLRTMIQIENSFFALASPKEQSSTIPLNTTQPDWKAWRRLEKETQRPLRPGLDIRTWTSLTTKWTLRARSTG